MFRTLLHFYRADRGATAVEFSLVFIPFFASLLFIAEMCRVVYISSAIDLILAESAQMASLTTAAENYEPYFNAELNRRMKTWPLLSRNLETVMTIRYCSGIEQAIAEQCSASNREGSPLALYHVQTAYQPMFFIFPTPLLNGELSRTVLLIQEFQEDANAS